jgi:hypothetical protein
MRKLFASAMLLTLAISMSGPTPVSAEPNSLDFTGSTEYHLVPCLTKTELDCVESFGFISKSGAYIGATSTTTQLTAIVGQNDNPVKQQLGRSSGREAPQRDSGRAFAVA